MRALVTGGTGFVGCHLIEALVGRGAEVTALVRSPAKAAARGFDRLGVRSVAGDLDDEGALAEAAAGQDVVFHVAGAIRARDEAGFLRVNRDGTERLVRAAAGVSRFVLVSTLAAAGPTEPGRPLPEEAPPRPVTAYGRSKLAGEEVVRASRLAWTILRPPTVYGPWDTEMLKVFRLARLGVAPLFGDGGQEITMVYAPDFAEALLAAAASERTVGRTYNASHPDTLTTRELVLAIGRAVGRRVRTFPLPEWLSRGVLTLTAAAARVAGRATVLTPDKANEFFQPAWLGDPAPLERDTGWRAAHDLAAGLAETAAWYREQGWL